MTAIVAFPFLGGSAFSQAAGDFFLAQSLSPTHLDPLAAADPFRSRFLGIDGGNHNDGSEEVWAYTLDRLRDGAPSKVQAAAIPRIFERLSPKAREGLYLLLVDGGILPSWLVDFLLRWSDPGVEKRTEALQLITTLYDYRVENYASVFSVREKNKKFLGTYEQFGSALCDLRYAAWIATNTDALRVRLGEYLPYRWENLTVEECLFLGKYVYQGPDKRDAFLSDSIFDDEETFTEIDILVETPCSNRAVEVKWSTKAIKELPLNKNRDELLIQVIRQGLVVRDNGLDGLEYVIYADQVAPSYLAVLRDALEATGVRYLIRIKGQGDRVVAENGLHYEVVEQPRPHERTRPLPPLPSVG